MAPLGGAAPSLPASATKSQLRRLQPRIPSMKNGGALKHGYYPLNGRFVLFALVDVSAHLLHPQLCRVTLPISQAAFMVSE